MQMSARILGQEYGLTAEEMNRVLVKLGYLEGSPGNYDPTEKAKEYVVEKDFHRGTGGYPSYNRYWTTRTFDDSIKEVLVIPRELIEEVREELRVSRAARYAAQAAERARANEEFLTKQAADKLSKEVADKALSGAEKLGEKLQKAGKYGLVIGGVVLVGYGIYKGVKKAKTWWRERNADFEMPEEEIYTEEGEENANVS